MAGQAQRAQIVQVAQAPPLVHRPDMICVPGIALHAVADQAVRRHLVPPGAPHGSQLQQQLSAAGLPVSGPPLDPPATSKKQSKGMCDGKRGRELLRPGCACEVASLNTQRPAARHCCSFLALSELCMLGLEPCQAPA